jgi:hypothetical protein
MSDDIPTLRDDLEKLAEKYGPLEVELIFAPEEFVAGAGVRRLTGAWSIQLGVSAMKAARKPSTEGTASIDHIGDLELVLSNQSIAALHAFLAQLVETPPARRPRQGDNMLPMYEPKE